MLRNKRHLIAIATFLIAWLLPVTGFCVVDDPYAFKSLIGRIYFEFERHETGSNTSTTKSTSFLQKYSLDTKGYAFSRLLFIYDGGVSFTKTNTSNYSADQKVSSTHYYFSTTILPLSYIPLTLYWNRDKSVSVADEKDTSIYNAYGLNWRLNFFFLPKTNLVLEKQTRDTSRGEHTTLNTTRVDLEKQIGRSHNTFTYNLVDSTDTSGNTSQRTLQFANNTEVSRSTSISVAAARNDGTSSSAPDTAVSALSLGLNSSPSREFNQTHSFNYYNSENGADKTTGSIYAGRMEWYITRRLTTHFSLNVNNTVEDSATSRQDNKTSSGSGTLSYTLTKTFYITQLLSYSKTSTDSSDPTANVADLETLRTLTRLNYMKGFNWAVLRTGVGAGYTKEKSQSVRAGEAIEENFYASLNKIDISKYFGADSSLRYSRRITIAGNDIHNTKQDYYLSVYNKVFKEYVNVNANYANSSTKTYLYDNAESKEVYRLSARTTFMKDTVVAVAASHTNRTQAIAGASQSTSKSFSVRHHRSLLGGALSAGFYFSTGDFTAEGSSYTTSSTRYDVGYNRRLLRDINWRATASRTVNKAAGSTTTATNIRNSFTYPFRSWLFSLDHTYSINEYQDTRLTDNILFLRASRVFIRIWQ